ncbi:hypothetical protein HII12_003859 [Brettanomyces bruxellensis]|uniref:Uncharacterized protein n=1 Tax=Dekkera bruxellensis TaxID=5007 RepID=A0A8H6BBZ6_DEKBR|nr:hypothetical protein HII12_003859 [Brettanomyces bruxellensis]
MSFVIRSAARSALKASCVKTSVIKATSLSARFNSTAAAKPEAAAKAQTESKKADEPIDPKIEQIVDSIAKLSLLETSSLIKALKSKLDIPDMAFPVAGAVGGGASPAAADAGAEEAKEKPKEKTIFNLKLESFDAKSKAKVIKEVKSELGLSLIKAKKLVESAPKVIKENMSKDDAEKFKKTLEKLGAKVTLE